MLELALHVLDILQNPVEAGATQVDLLLVEDEPADRLSITVKDNGRGMDEQTAHQVLNPFYTTRTTRHVGLGLPLYAAAAETAGGVLMVNSRPGEGTTVEATFQLSHPDRQPLGDMAGTLLAFLLAERAPELRYAHRVVGTRRGEVSSPETAAAREFTFDAAAIRAELDGIPLNQPLVAQWLAEFIAEGELSLR
jgi:anti-sigma regulatory factor (Ser/Thr protein kinase)